MAPESFDTYQTVNVERPSADIELPTSLDDHTDAWAARNTMPRSQNAIAWMLENALSNVLPERAVARIMSLGTVANSFIVGESAHSGAARHEQLASWQEASTHVSRTQRIIRNEKKMPEGWLNGRLVEPFRDIPNKHNPGRPISVEAGRKTVYTEIADQNYVSVLFPDMVPVPGLTYEVAVYPPFTKESKRDNYISVTAKRTAAGYTELALMLRVSNHGSVLASGHCARTIHRADCSETEGSALLAVTRKTYDEIYKLRHNGLPVAPL